ncbi:MAG: hypothetical protein KAS73_09030 [Candidatus Sabulitectum sp.]|nr:hypothetical protein [Candidatus Sabulitectum sp.]
MIRFAFFLPLLYLSFNAWGTTITVHPGDDISDSLLTLSHGDTLFLTPGVYINSEEQSFLTAGPMQSGVIITSEQNDRAVLDGQNLERSILSLVGPHDSFVIIENLIITGGNATGTNAFNGGGISASESKAIVSNCLVTGNTALIGGGIGAEGGILQVQYSTLSNNEALVTGGGIDLYSCNFTGHMNKFISNTSSDDGGGLNAYQSTLELSNSLFQYNYSGDDGGAITVLQGTSNFSFLTLNLNEAFDDGGGMRIHTTDSVSVVSSIVTSNLGKGGINVISANIPFISHVCCWNNTFANYHGMEDPTGSDGNISEDPLFADSDLNLSQLYAGQPENSPAVNAGHSAVENTSISGLSTRTDSLPDTAVADMGFHHFNTEQTGIPPELSERTVTMIITPSPATTSADITLSRNIPLPVTIHVFDINGRRIHTADSVYLTNGEWWTWQPDDCFSGGLVLFMATWPGGNASGKVVMLP